MLLLIKSVLHLVKSLSDKIEFVLQGVVVTVKPEYKLSYEDAIWFHPEMAKVAPFIN